MCHGCVMEPATRQEMREPRLLFPQASFDPIVFPQLSLATSMGPRVSHEDGTTRVDVLTAQRWFADSSTLWG
jgi:hypothetical protein